LLDSETSQRIIELLSESTGTNLELALLRAKENNVIQPVGSDQLSPDHFLVRNSKYDSLIFARRSTQKPDVRLFVGRSFDDDATTIGANMIFNFNEMKTGKPQSILQLSKHDISALRIGNSGNTKMLGAVDLVIDGESIKIARQYGEFTRADLLDIFKECEESVQDSVDGWMIDDASGLRLRRY
jgi:hypothetical protein